MTPKYDILALDLDGTLLRSDATVSPANVRALHDARDAGLRVVVCTGRGWAECRSILKTIEQVDPVVVAGGSIVAEPLHGETLHRIAMDHDLVRESVDAMLDSGHAALVLKDPHEVGYEYLVVHGADSHPLDPVTRWWFDTMQVRVRAVTHLDEDIHRDHTVRVGACAPSSQLAALAARLERAAHGRGIVHHFPAVVAPAHARAGNTHGTMHVLELFDVRATKWEGISHLAHGWGVPAARIMAIGDEVNDESMIRHAGLGVAMGNAVPLIRDVAQRQTATNNDDGVAVALRAVLDGVW